VSGDLELGGSNIPGQYILPGFIGGFKGNYPDIRIRLVIADTTKITDMVMEGSLELGVVGAEIKNTKLQFHRLFDDELVLAVPANHPWADLDIVSPEQLSEVPFIMREQGSGTRMAMTNLFEQAGFDPQRLHVVAEMGSTEAIRQAVKANVGVSILSDRAIACDVHFQQLCQVPIQGLTFPRHFYLVTHKNRSRSPLAQAFIDVLMEERVG
jgi:DNA-binding transcriptional LysR family regulator